jgi:hypothetical protein
MTMARNSWPRRAISPNASKTPAHLITTDIIGSIDVLGLGHIVGACWSDGDGFGLLFRVIENNQGALGGANCLIPGIKAEEGHIMDSCPTGSSGRGFGSCQPDGANCA